jgi:acetyl-CoA C-acetyltransferase
MSDVGTGRGGLPMGIALRLPNIGVTRVENFCAGGSEAVRAAVYAVAPANFAQLASAYRHKHGVDATLLKRAMAHVSVKSHANGARNPKAHLQKPVTEEQVLKAPTIAEPLGLFDCCGVSDGAAAVVVTRPDIARNLGKRDLVCFKALQVSTSNGWEMHSNDWDGSYFHTARIAAKRAYKEAGIEKPRLEVSMLEVHDCFSITELVTMEDLFLSPEGGEVQDVMDGVFDAEGKIPCQIDGGLKCFGHPVGASGIRMLYEMYLQLQGRAGPRQLKNPRIGLTHNLGGQPSQNVCSVSIVGLLAA